MLNMTKKTGYGLIAMTHLASLGDGELACARKISEQFGLPTSLMMNVLKQLSAAGFVESVRGARGGYRLAKCPEDISLADLVEALEGPVRLAECVAGLLDNENEICQLMDRCPIADPVHRVQRKLSEFLRDLTLDELTEHAGTKVAG